MPDSLADLLPWRQPTTESPLMGVTMLLVEDSRFACEAIRLMCLRSGARLRRADCLQSAKRHLQCYRPNLVIIDLGLPDGSGLDLIATLARQVPRVSAIVATSGDADAAQAALDAGADRFLAKPVESIVVFQQMVLALLPGRPSAVPGSDRDERSIAPDPAAFRDDLIRAAAMLEPEAESDLDYVARFLAGVAVSAHDTDLRRAAVALQRDRASGALRLVKGLVRTRLASHAGL